MNEQKTNKPDATVSRRGFLKTASVAVAGTAAISSFPFVVTTHAAADDPIRVGLIGCGGRGTGAAENVQACGAGNVKIVAVADIFEDAAKGAADKFKVAPDQCFSGFDAFQKVCSVPEVNYIILATPPGFRAAHFEAAIKAGKHVFTEKPVCVDGPTYRQFVAAGKLAAEKKLCVVAGTQRRHQAVYIETIKKIQEGAIGDVLCLRAYWNTGAIWHRGDVGATEMEKQVRNWYHYCWLSGDHICEQHVHNLDVCNWVMQDHPIRAYAMGGRQALGNKSGHIWDHFAVEFEYKNGVRMFSQCRQINGTDGNVSEAVVGTKGIINNLQSGNIQGVFRYQGPKPNEYEVEHADLIAAIRGTAPYVNEAQRVADSTLTAIMGREAAYSGKIQNWDEAIAWKTCLLPEKMEWGPGAKAVVPIPGVYDIS